MWGWDWRVSLPTASVHTGGSWLCLLQTWMNVPSSNIAVLRKLTASIPWAPTTAHANQDLLEMAYSVKVRWRAGPEWDNHGAKVVLPCPMGTRGSMSLAHRVTLCMPTCPLFWLPYFFLIFKRLLLLHCVCAQMCGRMHSCTGAHICEYVWRPEVNFKFLSQESFTLGWWLVMGYRLAGPLVGLSSAAVVIIVVRLFVSCFVLFCLEAVFLVGAPRTRQLSYTGWPVISRDSGISICPEWITHLCHHTWLFPPRC